VSVTNDIRTAETSVRAAPPTYLKAVIIHPAAT